jgi:hypothetical protein
MTEQQPEPTPAEPEHVHGWGIIDVWHPSPAVMHPRVRPEAFTVALIRCRTCDMPRTIELQGTWSLTQLLQNHARIEHRDGG